MGLKVEDSPQVINPSFAGCCCCPFVVVVVVAWRVYHLLLLKRSIFGVTISVAKVTSM